MAAESLLVPAALAEVRASRDLHQVFGITELAFCSDIHTDRRRNNQLIWDKFAHFLAKYDPPSAAAARLGLILGPSLLFFFFFFFSFVF
jgi:hypothetical protein